ncbi:MAG TPA: hypothetical protein VMD59_03235 [Acidimicrobiales bacterium]|nr:hypothetical protein [Acidimicrobiales bacterium]
MTGPVANPIRLGTSNPQPGGQTAGSPAAGPTTTTIAGAGAPVVVTPDDHPLSTPAGTRGKAFARTGVLLAGGSAVSVAVRCAGPGACAGGLTLVLPSGATPGASQVVSRAVLGRLAQGHARGVVFQLDQRGRAAAAALHPGTELRALLVVRGAESVTEPIAIRSPV